MGRARNRICFDPSKEAIRVIHPEFGAEQFGLLGFLFDCRLNMLPCLDALLAMLRPKADALVRLRYIFDTASLLNQFKAHI